jgi:hypothetical protein
MAELHSSLTHAVLSTGQEQSVNLKQFQILSLGLKTKGTVCHYPCPPLSSTGYAEFWSSALAASADPLLHSWSHHCGNLQKPLLPVGVFMPSVRDNAKAFFELLNTVIHPC